MKMKKEKCIKKRVEAFNKHYAPDNIKAKIEFIPRSENGGGYEDKVNAALITSTVAGCYYFGWSQYSCLREIWCHCTIG